MCCAVHVSHYTGFAADQRAALHGAAVDLLILGKLVCAKCDDPVLSPSQTTTAL
jgi:hypothetical protein